MLVISPFAQVGTINHEQFDTRSVLKFIEQVFNLPQLAKFKRSVNSISDMLVSQPIPNITETRQPLIQTDLNCPKN